MRWNSERGDECDEKEGMEIQVEDNGESNGLLITEGEWEMEWSDNRRERCEREEGIA